MTLSVLDDIIELLEADIPANPNSAKNQKLKRKMELLFAKYFDAMANAFPYSKLDGIYNKYVQESAESSTRGILDPILDAINELFTADIEGELVEVYLAGQAEMVTWGKTLGGIPIAYEGPPMQNAITWAKKQGAMLVTNMNDETKRRLAGVVGDAINNKRGIPGLSRDLRNTFSDMSKYRSELIARTETANALSQSSLSAMADMGIEGKEWVTAGDSQVSEECQGNEAEGVIPVDQAFSGGVMAPPQHPDAVFEGYTFYPYGTLTQMLSSRYDGPAVTIEAEIIEYTVELSSGDTASLPDSFNRDIIIKHSSSGSDLLIRNRSGESIPVFPERIQLTIGPNHPVLTRRGFVNAQFLDKGDELIYDGRSKLSAGITESYFKQIHTIEDIFSAIASISGYSSIPAASNYFHGDEVFCNGEINVVRPKRNLLSVCDVRIIEHSSKCNLTGTYANAEHVSSCSSCQFALNGIFATTASSMSSSSHIGSHSNRNISPSFFHSYRLIGTHKTSYTGMAFDASTSTELYNIGGLVVKNCRCAVAPAIIRKR